MSVAFASAPSRVGCARTQCAPSPARAGLPGHGLPTRPMRAARAPKLNGSVGEAPTASLAVEKSGPNFKAKKDIQEIMDILPHRCARRPGQIGGMVKARL